MNYKIEVLNDLPVLIATWNEEFKYSQDGPSYAVEVNTKLSEQKSPVYYIMDFTRYKEMSMNELLEASSRAARTKGSNFHNPMTKSVIMVTTNEMLALAAEGFRSAVFGNVDMHTFSTLEDALKYVRENKDKTDEKPAAADTSAKAPEKPGASATAAKVEKPGVVNTAAKVEKPKPTTTSVKADKPETTKKS